VSAAQVQVSTLNLQDTTNSASIFALYNEGGLLYFNGSAVGGTAVISSNLGLSNLNLLDTLSTSSTFTNFVSAAQVQVSTLNLQDTTNSASIAALYNEGGLLYYNGSAVGGSISSNLGLSNLNLLDTLSTSSTFTNSISSANAFIDTISSMMVYGSTIVSEQMSSLSIYAGSGIVGQLDVSQANKVYLTPLTLGTGDNTILYYNSGTGEITYSNAPTSSSVSDQFSTLFTSSFVASTIQLNNGIIEIKPTTEAIAIGTGAGTTSQGSNSVAIGNQAGYMNQGSNCVAIGAYAGSNAQAARSIVINATGVTLNNTTEQSFVVKPVRNATSFGTQMNYDATSGEITYGTPSDSNLKENIATTSNYFDSLLKLRPVEYSFKEDVSSIRHIGFIAQEVQPLLPALVEQHNSTLYINYNAFHPMYITAFQSLQSTNQGLQQQLSGTQQQLQQQITENRTLIQTLFSTLNLSM
jgi:hypothetical protein